MDYITIAMTISLVPIVFLLFTIDLKNLDESVLEPNPIVSLIGLYFACVIFFPISILLFLKLLFDARKK